MRLFLWITLATATILVLSCGDSTPSEPPPPPDPIPGWLKIRLNSPNSDDGGIMFMVSGGQIDSVRSAFSDLFVSQGSTTAKRVIVGGDLTSGGLLVEIRVPDVASISDYAITVEQVAARENFQQRQVSAYSLAVER